MSARTWKRNALASITTPDVTHRTVVNSAHARGLPVFALHRSESERDRILQRIACADVQVARAVHVGDRSHAEENMETAREWRALLEQVEA